MKALSLQNRVEFSCWHSWIQLFLLPLPDFHTFTTVWVTSVSQTEAKQWYSITLVKVHWAHIYFSGLILVEICCVNFHCHPRIAFKPASEKGVTVRWHCSMTQVFNCNLFTFERYVSHNESAKTEICFAVDVLGTSAFLSVQFQTWICQRTGCEWYMYWSECIYHRSRSVCFRRGLRQGCPNKGNAHIIFLQITGRFSANGKQDRKKETFEGVTERQTKKEWRGEEENGERAWEKRKKESKPEGRGVRDRPRGKRETKWGKVRYRMRKG